MLVVQRKLVETMSRFTIYYGISYLSFSHIKIPLRLRFTMDRLQHLGDNALSLGFPLLSILEGIVKEFPTAYAKNTTVLEFLGQWDNVEVKKTNFSFVPIHRWI